MNQLKEWPKGTWFQRQLLKLRAEQVDQEIREINNAECPSTDNKECTLYSGHCQHCFCIKISWNMQLCCKCRMTWVNTSNTSHSRAGEQNAP
jgi:hypothetical protein